MELISLLGKKVRVIVQEEPLVTVDIPNGGLLEVKESAGSMMPVGAVVPAAGDRTKVVEIPVRLRGMKDVVLPKPAAGVWYVVDQEVLDIKPGRMDLFAPDGVELITKDVVICRGLVQG